MELRKRCSCISLVQCRLYGSASGESAGQTLRGKNVGVCVTVNERSMDLLVILVSSCLLCAHHQQFGAAGDSSHGLIRRLLITSTSNKFAGTTSSWCSWRPFPRIDALLYPQQRHSVPERSDIRKRWGPADWPKLATL